MFRTEKALSHFIQKTFSQAYWERIENTASTGMPDLHGFYDGDEIWLELKVGKPLLQPSQISWFTKRQVENMHSQYVICASKVGELHVYDLISMDAIVKKGDKFLLMGSPAVYDSRSRSEMQSLFNAITHQRML